MGDSDQLKIGIFGGGGVGKTCITIRYLKNEFTEGYIPTIEDEFSKIVEVDNKTVSLSIVDTAGQDDFAEMRFSYYKKVQGFVLVFDIGNPSSIDDLKQMYDDISNSIEGDTVHCVVAANKADLRQEDRTDLVSVSEYANLETEFKCKVVETSARTGTNVKELFETLIRQFISPKKDKASSKTADKKEKDKSEEGGCCEIA